VDAETRYAKSGDAYIAYQVLGDDGPDLLYLSSGTISIDSIDDEPDSRGSIVTCRRSAG
jgi:hypothetical protein